MSSRDSVLGAPETEEAQKCRWTTGGLSWPRPHISPYLSTHVSADVHT